MSRFDKLNQLIYNKRITPSNEQSISWRLKDIESAILDLNEKEFTIGAIDMCFTWPDGYFYAPMWGDCVMLDNGNLEYLGLFNNVDVTKPITIDTIMQLVRNFDLIVAYDLDNPKDFKLVKQSIIGELKDFDLEKMFFSLYIEY